jgi:hypothetical protein
MSDIGKRKRELDRLRQQKMKELMDEFDKTVYYPKMNQIIEECAKEGHSGGKYHDNGFGWSWFYCGKCGGRYDITGPNREKK